MKNRIAHLVAGFLILIFPVVAPAQCSTCAAAAETSLQQGSSAAEGLNDGILYLLAIPAIAAIVFYLIYRKRQQFLAKFDN